MNHSIAHSLLNHKSQFSTGIAGCTSASVFLSSVNLTISAWLNEMVVWHTDCFVVICLCLWLMLEEVVNAVRSQNPMTLCPFLLRMVENTALYIILYFFIYIKKNDELRWFSLIFSIIDQRNHVHLMKWMGRRGIVLFVHTETMQKHLNVPFVTQEKGQPLGGILIICFLLYIVWCF